MWSHRGSSWGNEINVDEFTRVSCCLQTFRWDLVVWKQHADKNSKELNVRYFWAGVFVKFEWDHKNTNNYGKFTTPTCNTTISTGRWRLGRKIVLVCCGHRQPLHQKNWSHSKDKWSCGWQMWRGWFHGWAHWIQSDKQARKPWSHSERSSLFLWLWQRIHEKSERKWDSVNSS